MTVELQLYMWSGRRQSLLEKHDFYVNQIKSKIFVQFNDLEGDAERYSEIEYDRLGALPGDENSDMEQLAELAAGRAEEFYSLLSDLQRQMVLGALAGLYHQWDKDLRKFLDQELSHNTDAKNIKILVWQPPLSKVIEVVEKFGWKCSSLLFYDKIRACNMIVNVHKHGKGSSLVDLKNSYPIYLDRGLPKGMMPSFINDYIDYESLMLTENQFDEIAEALRAFWVAFPERLFLKIN